MQTKGDPLENLVDHMSNEIDDMEIDMSDLSEWLDETELGFDDLLELSEGIKDLQDNGSVFSTDIFDNELSTFTKSNRKRTRRPSRVKHSRQYESKRNRRISKKIRRDDLEYMTPSVCKHPFSDSAEYSQAVKKLVASMKKTELSRAASTQALPEPSSSTLSSLGCFFSGKRTSLTAGLENSRKQLRAYMSLLLTNQTL